MATEFVQEAVAEWLSRDPLGEGTDATLYSYVGNDPVGAIDPLGLWQFTVTGGVGLGASFSIGYNDGHWNDSAAIGVGAGISFAYDPNTSNPNNPNGANPASVSIGATASATGGIGKYLSVKGEVSATAKAGNYCNGEDVADLGVSASASAGAGVKGSNGKGLAKLGQGFKASAGLTTTEQPNTGFYANPPTQQLPTETVLGSGFAGLKIGFTY